MADTFEITGRCPKCGSPMICNGNAVWCTFIGGAGEHGCDYSLNLRPRIGHIQILVLPEYIVPLTTGGS